MIAPMKKLYLLIPNRNLNSEIEHLRELGLVHVETKDPKGEDYSRSLENFELVSKALAMLPVQKKGAKAELATSSSDALKIANEIVHLDETKKQLQNEDGFIIRELNRIKAFGQIEVDKIRALQNEGYFIFLYEVDAKRLSTMPKEIDYVVLNRSNKSIKILVFSKKQIELVPSDFIACALPETSTSRMEERENEIKKEIADIETKLVALACEKETLKKSISELSENLEFYKVCDSFETVDEVSYVKAYVPVKNEKDLIAFVKNKRWGIISQDPEDEDMPPTKVENNALIRIVAPVFDFLGVVPAYREYDISFWFLLFFTIFFAMIFGDGGYGSLMLLAGIIFGIKSKIKTGKVADIFRLLILLSGATVVWGILTASWFGLPADMLPEFLTVLSVPLISNLSPSDVAGTNIKILCFIIGAIQLSLAHIKNIMRDFPNPKFIGQLGSLMLVIGMFPLVLNLVIDPVRFPMETWSLTTVAVGLGLVFVFGNWTGNIFTSLLAGLANIIPTFIGTVSVFADIVSYIRLWAVGLAGVAISVTVNGMGGALFKPFFMIFIGVAILLFGHTLNVVMSVLSVVVHGVRLNMLEFSGHLGMEWSGYKYNPFKKTVQKDKKSE